jgi:dephospho-CoA kinase
MRSDILVVVGLPGSGKTTVAMYFQKKGYSVVRMGEVTDQILKDRRIHPSEKTEKVVREELRDIYGDDIYAVLVLPKIISAREKNNSVVIDGLRKISEYDYFKKYLKVFKIIYIDVPYKVRFKRLAVRKERPIALEDAKKRDKTESQSFDIRELRKKSDIVVKNNSSMKALLERLSNI